ncbi:hypothetical protein QL285_055225 [Trifolium repens]|nr:hypothetical protein QL285_055225 [Trifolium repens]
MSVKFCPNLLNFILSLNSNVLCHCKKREIIVKDQKTLWSSNWVKIWIKGFIQHKFIIFIKFAIKIGFEYGINSIETADLCDNVR